MFKYNYINQKQMQMNEWRARHLEERERKDVEIFEKIKDDPNASVDDLWSLSGKRFIEWRKLHDFPRLLEHFDAVLPGFMEWKLEFGLSNDTIIQSGKITQFIEKKRVRKSRALRKRDRKKVVFLTIQKLGDHELTILSNTKLEGKKEFLGNEYEFTFIREMESYLDWSERNNRFVKVLSVVERSAPGFPQERVFINAIGHSNNDNFELLKMGGIKIPKNAFNILLRGKYLEFANLCGLELEGEIHFGEMGNLQCSYCVCDNWKAVNMDMPMFKISNSLMLDFKSVDSKLTSWKFYGTKVTGNFINTQLQRVLIIDGNFDPLMQSCTLFDTEIVNDTYTYNNNLNGFKTFKKLYEAQGEDKLAKSYYVLENEFLRSKLTGFDLFTKSLSFYYWEYGSKPHRIIYCSIFMILFFSLIYWLNSDLISINTASGECFNFANSLYFSTITFTTLGYGDYSPQSWLKILAAIESFLGVINTGFLLAGYANNKY
jgi:hypothetical protein